MTTINHMDYVKWSGQSQLICAIASYTYNQGYLTYGLVALYFSTLLYWGPLKNHIWMRNLDMFIATSNILAISVYYSRYYLYRNVWLFGIAGCSAVYFINDYVFSDKSTNMIVHCVFLHVCPALLWLYCIYNTHL